MHLSVPTSRPSKAIADQWRADAIAEDPAAVLLAPSSSEGARQKAIEILIERPSRESVNALFRGASQLPQEIGAACLCAIAKMDHADTVLVFKALRISAQAVGSPDVRIQIYRSLSGLKANREAAKRVVEEGLSDPDRAVRKAVGELLK